MQITREDLNPCTVQLKVVCDTDEVQKGYETAFKQLTKKIKLPGFRPGKAPKAMLEQVVPAEQLDEAAAEEIVRVAYAKAVEDQGLTVDRSTAPMVSVEKLEKATYSAEFSVKVPLPPVVELGDYKGLPVEQPSADVTEEQIDRWIEEQRKRGQTRVAVTDRGAEEGDIAVINLKAEGEDGEGRNFMAIIGQTFPQLDDALRGLRVEEIKNLELTFPESFHEKEFANTTKNVQVTINSLTAVTLPALDDAFAQSLQSESVEDLRNRVREAIGGAKQHMVRQIVHEKLIDVLAEKSTVHVSENMWETLANRRLQETAQEQARQGKSFEAYAQENGMTVDQLVQAWRDRAKLEVERALVIQKVFAEEQLGLTNQDLNQELFIMAGEYGMDAGELLKALQANQSIDELQFRALARKVGDFLLANAEVKIVDGEAAAEAEAPAAEAAAEEPAPKPKKKSTKKEAAPAAEEAAPEAEA